MIDPHGAWVDPHDRGRRPARPRPSTGTDHARPGIDPHGAGTDPARPGSTGDRSTMDPHGARIDPIDARSIRTVQGPITLDRASIRTVQGLIPLDRDRPGIDPRSIRTVQGPILHDRGSTHDRSARCKGRSTIDPRGRGPRPWPIPARPKIDPRSIVVPNHTVVTCLSQRLSHPHGQGPTTRSKVPLRRSITRLD
jgi:hypothetical protein